MSNMTPLHTADGTVFLENLPMAAMSCDAISGALGKINRFAGRTPKTWSVALHSVLVSQLCTIPEEKALGLLHDGHEAFLGDWITPAVQFIANQSRPVVGSIVENAVKQAKASLDRQIFRAWSLHPTAETVAVVAHYDHIAFLAESIFMFGLPDDFPDDDQTSQDVDRATQLMRNLPLDAHWQSAREIWCQEVKRIETIGTLLCP